LQAGSFQKHQTIIDKFVSIYENSFLEKKDLIRVLVRQVDSFVGKKNEGEIHITIVADHYLEAE